MSTKSAERRRAKRKAKSPQANLAAQPTFPREISLQGVPLRNVQEWIHRASLGARVPPQQQDNDAITKLQKTIPGIATNAWRAQKKMINVETGEPKEELRRIYRHVEAILDALADAGVEIVDPCGQAYDTGMALKVVSAEEREGLRREEIIETLKPTVREHGRILQLGEVVIGIPKVTNIAEPLKAQATSDQKGQ